MVLPSGIEFMISLSSERNTRDQPSAQTIFQQPRETFLNSLLEPLRGSIRSGTV